MQAYKYYFYVGTMLLYYVFKFEAINLYIYINIYK